MAIIRRTLQILLVLSLFNLPVNAVPTKTDTEFISGKVGIGTETPASKLHVYSNTPQEYPVLFDFYSNNTNNTGLIGPIISNLSVIPNSWVSLLFADQTGGYSAGSIGLQFKDHVNNYGDMAFFTNSAGGYTEKMRITSTGNVGIGAPTPEAKLDVAGPAVFGGTRSTLDGTSTLLVGTRPANDGLASIRLSAATNSVWSFDAGGTKTSSNNFFQIYDATSGAGTRLYIDTAGNVGIGTTIPGKKLEVNGDIKANDICTASGKCLNAASMSVPSSSFTSVQFSTPSSTTWQVPSGVTKIRVKVCGGGGNGGAGSSYYPTTSGYVGAGGGGGGSGGCGEAIIDIPAGTASYSYTVGGQGASSSFGGGLITATGGTSGGVGYVNSMSATGGLAGIGGSAGGTAVGVIVKPGLNGAAGTSTICSGSFSSLGRGGTGGNSPILLTGGAAGGVVSCANTPVAPGSNAVVSAAGGGGGGTASGAGGLGAAGLVVIENYTGSKYETSCAVGSLNYNFPYCCRIDTRTGETTCKMSNQNNNLTTMNWVDYGTPFPATTTSGTDFGIACIPGSQSQVYNYPTCFRTNKSSGAVECKYSSSFDTGGAWTTCSPQKVWL